MQEILNKLHEIMKEADYIQKDAKNKFHGYKYASELAIKTKLHELLVKHGVLFQLQSCDSRIITDLELTKDGKEQKATLLKCKYTFWDIDSGEKLEGDFMASGPARDDKGLWAATTNAIKYIMTSTFLIPTGDDAESDLNHPENGKTTPKSKAKPKAKPKDANTQAPPETRRTVFGRAIAAVCAKAGVTMPTTAEGKKALLYELTNTAEFGALSLKLKETPTPEIGPNDEGWETFTAIIQVISNGSDHKERVEAIMRGVKQRVELSS